MFDAFDVDGSGFLNARELQHLSDALSTDPRHQAAGGSDAESVVIATANSVVEGGLGRRSRSASRRGFFNNNNDSRGSCGDALDKGTDSDEHFGIVNGDNHQRHRRRHNNRSTRSLSLSRLEQSLSFTCLLYTSPSPRDRG